MSDILDNVLDRWTQNHGDSGDSGTVSSTLLQAREVGLKLDKSFAFIATGKPGRLTRPQMLSAAEVLINELAAIGEKISPNNVDGYDDPDDPFSSDCLRAWRYMLRQAHERRTLQ